MKCEKCQEEHNGEFGSGRFCSRKCSNSRIKTVDIKNKISTTLLKFNQKYPKARYNVNRWHKHTEETKEKIRQSSLKRLKNNELDNFIGTGNKVHRQIELEYKPIIEKYFKTQKLKPQQIGKRWFDFTNKEYIIELTLDATAGIQEAIKRFETIINDKRIKILIAPSLYFGDKRRERLNKTGAKFIDIGPLA